MSQSPIESDQRLLERVTDALRAGPGTVHWEQVLRELSPGVSGSAGTDPDGIRAETELLLRVRERLAMGRSWREVRAGEGFTRRLMDKLDQQPPSAGSPVTLWIFGLAMVAVLGVMLWGVVTWYGTWDRPEPPSSADGAGHAWRPGGVVVAYGSPWVVWDFGRPWPGQTLLVGGLHTEADGDGWRPEIGPLSDAGNPGPAGRAALLTLPLPLSRGGGVCVVEVELDAPPDIDPALSTHLFLATSLDADAQLATLPAGGEWVWQLQSSGQSVVLGDGSVAILPRSPKRDGFDGRRMTVQVQVSDGGRLAAVSVNGEPSTRGPTLLNLPTESAGELFLGVRFVARGELRGPVVTVRSVRVYPGR